MAVSLGDTFSGPNGFSRIPSSSYLSCCSSCALNSSSPSNASARCWYDVVSNRRCLDSEEPRLDAAVALVARRVCTVHLSLVMDRSMKGGMAEHDP
uniref:NEK2 n=1 Tax=Arundo donax TaxID=35708 RepID=A0A0A8XN98_ARUDO